MKKIILIAALLTCTLGATAQNKNDVKTNDKLVVYFSCTGTTKGVAQKLAELLGADLFSIDPVKAYTAKDLDWRDKQSRSSVEMNDKSSRPAIANNVANMKQYKTVYIGFPVWWNLAPTIINTFLESYDFAGITVIPFATSGGSGLENSEKSLRQSYPQITWKTGKLLNGNINKTTLSGWAE